MRPAGVALLVSVVFRSAALADPAQSADAALPSDASTVLPGEPSAGAQPQLGGVGVMELGPEVPLNARRLRAPKAAPAESWIEKQFGAPEILDVPGSRDGGGRTLWIQSIAGDTAFVHRAEDDGSMRVGLVDASGGATVWTGEIDFSPWTRLVVIPVPGRARQLVVCLAESCRGPQGCAKASAESRRRQCVWLAPDCPGSPAVALDRRFGNVERRGGRLIAEVFTSSPRCLPGEGPHPRWSVESGLRAHSSWGPCCAVRGELEPRSCAPPRWRKTLGVFTTSMETGRELRVSDVPACAPDGRMPGAPP